VRFKAVLNRWQVGIDVFRSISGKLVLQAWFLKFKRLPIPYENVLGWWVSRPVYRGCHFVRRLW